MLYYLYTKHTTKQRHGWSVITMCFAKKGQVIAHCYTITMLHCYTVSDADN